MFTFKIILISLLLLAGLAEILRVIARWRSISYRPQNSLDDNHHMNSTGIWVKHGMVSGTDAEGYPCVRPQSMPSNDMLIALRS